MAVQSIPPGHAWLEAALGHGNGAYPNGNSHDGTYTNGNSHNGNGR